MNDDQRRRLADAQRDLLAALVAGAPNPPGFDPVRLRIQSHSLIAKRRGLVAAALPDVVATLGQDFAPTFFTYANGHPKPPGGSRADAQSFLQWLHDQGHSPEEWSSHPPTHIDLRSDPAPPGWWASLFRLVGKDPDEWENQGTPNLWHTAARWRWRRKR